MRERRALLPLAICALVVLTSALPGNAEAAAQGDTVADRVFGQGGSFTSDTINLGGISASSLWNAGQLALDANGNLYVSDNNNSRVLVYNQPLSTDTVADFVFGQNGNFTSNTANKGGISASSLNNPNGITVDGSSNLYVAGLLNNRVLEYDSPLTTNTVADRVFGQGGSFTANDCPKPPTDSSLCQPFGVAVDSAGNLYVSDRLNHRVLEYDSPLTDQVADRVFGQGGSFTSNTPNLGGISASSLNLPFGIAVDSADNLYVADRSNHRVLVYESPLTTDTVADHVLGQPDFFSNTCNAGGISATSLCRPFMARVDGAGNLYVSDVENNRVLEYDSPLTTDTVADRVFGQGGSFTSATINLGGISASSLNNPNGLAVDGAGNLYVGDATNARVLVYDSPLTAVGGIAELPEVAGTPLDAPESSGLSAGILVGVAGAVAAGAVALGGAAWYARRRRLR